ncbi:MAG TPA: family 16 glycoside hydrolase, partial [Verrucomicrobiae bacterium]|nr:family 16 glycoside hydrolase [Verrucomicrobiae bacterium]
MASPFELIIRAEPPLPKGKTIPLFDGKTLAGWEGDPKFWRVQDGVITGGSLTEAMTHNDFVCTTGSFTNFILRLKFKITGTDGFINSGVQIRSQRVPNDHEVAGYQCDLGDPAWWGTIYDEARRNVILVPSDMKAVEPVLRRNDWNDYVIRADGPHLTLWINGAQTADYIEPDPNIPDYGVFGFQVHGGGKVLAQFKDITLQELPPPSPKTRFIGVREPGPAAKASPLPPEEERASFSVPPGFEVELVASDPDVGKIVTVAFDDSARMWGVTALEYPVDGNENAEQAKDLYKRGGKDRVVIWDTPTAPGPHKARTFADNLAMPMAVLPYKDGAFIQHGQDVLFLRDTNHDGRADTREVILTGFGIQDSHLMPHQFTRIPGGWIFLAQGAFNYSQVKTKWGEVTQFDHTKLARFTPDGKKFEIVGYGPCNIWGLTVGREGEVFIQEANDYGYPVMPFHVGGNYPGCGDYKFKPYAPFYPGLATNFAMGGTGLSGLAFSDSHNGFPAPYADVMYVANPITRKVQAIKMHHDGPRYRLQLLGDFMTTSDEWFRPVAIHFGPDNCLYVVDWYNKIISHNEVPRTHPDRDKTRGRVWRVRHRDMARTTAPDIAKAGDESLLKYLASDSTWEMRAA